MKETDTQSAIERAADYIIDSYYVDALNVYYEVDWTIDKLRTGLCAILENGVCNARYWAVDGMQPVFYLACKLYQWPRLIVMGAAHSFDYMPEYRMEIMRRQAARNGKSFDEEDEKREREHYDEYHCPDAVFRYTVTEDGGVIEECWPGEMEQTRNTVRRLRAEQRAAKKRA